VDVLKRLDFTGPDLHFLIVLLKWGPDIFSGVLSLGPVLHFPIEDLLERE
jgi:hypothetical protein